MGKLGIAIGNDSRQNESLGLSYPLLAFSYYRSGFIRLAGKKFKIRK